MLWKLLPLQPPDKDFLKAKEKKKQKQKVPPVKKPFLLTQTQSQFGKTTHLPAILSRSITQWPPRLHSHMEPL